jgi:sugar lactone lactonase YvrE
MGRTTRILCEDIQFGEAPRWRQGRLWFSDFFAHAVKSISLAGDLRTEIEIDDQPSGLGWMPDGSLLFVSMIRRQLLRRSVDGDTSVHADLSRIAGFHCNDIVVDSKGCAYVGEFGFDLAFEMKTRPIQSLVDGAAVAKLIRVAPDGRIVQVIPDMHFPNGTVITPDNRTLIVAETLGRRLTAFDIAADGSLANRRVWAKIAPRLPDGIALDADGHVWVANAGAPECVLFAPDGKVLEVIDTGMPCYACMLGGNDGRTLFMFTAMGVGAVKGKLLVATVDVPHDGRP